MNASWLEHLILSSALGLESSSKTIFQFTNKVRQTLHKMPVQEWEAAAWARGLKTGLLKMEGYFFRAGAGKRAPLSFFIRNEAGVYVGLRREAITQAATYVSLITDYGYSRERTRFESRWMDVAVYDEQGKALIYAENKANAKILEKLCQRLMSGFMDGVDFTVSEEDADDVLRKAQHIWREKPRYFWAVSPVQSYAYRIQFFMQGFQLARTERIQDYPF
jgi:hypothetical protein